MKISTQIEIVDGLPFAYLHELDAIVCADLHLGYEYALAVEQGIFLPGTQFERIMGYFTNIVEKYAPNLLIINGDLKHIFGSRSWQEYREVKEILSFLNTNLKHTVLVRGNHDNFVRGMFSRFDNVDFVEPYYKVKKYLFTHGHIFNLDILENIKESNIVILGHEHPAILLSDDVGGKIKLPAFLFGKTKFNNDILVLPAVSPLMSGVDVNRITQKELLSPVLKRITDLYELMPYAVEINKKIWEFPKLKLWHIQHSNF